MPRKIKFDFYKFHVIFLFTNCIWDTWCCRSIFCRTDWALNCYDSDILPWIWILFYKEFLPWKKKLFYYSNDSESGTCGFSKLKKICKAGDRSKFSSLCEEKRNWADSIPKELKMRNIDCIVPRLVLCIIGVACKNKPSFQGLWPHGKIVTLQEIYSYLWATTSWYHRVTSSSSHRWVAYKVYSLPLHQPARIKQNSDSDCSLPWSSFENGLIFWALLYKWNFITKQLQPSVLNL